MKRAVGAEAGELGIDGVSRSQNVSRSELTEVFLLPAELRLSLPGLPGIDIGAGAYVSAASVTDLGFLVIPSGVNSYEGSNASTFYGPLLSLGTRLDAGFLELSPGVLVVPYFLFRSSQSLRIDPLLAAAGAGDISYTGSGFPWVALSLDARLFSLLGLDLAWELNRQDARILNVPDADHAAWWGREARITTSSFKLLGNLLIPLPDGSGIKLGFGRRFTRSTEEGQSPIVSAKSVFNIAYELKR